MEGTIGGICVASKPSAVPVLLGPSTANAVANAVRCRECTSTLKTYNEVPKNPKRILLYCDNKECPGTLASLTREKIRCHGCGGAHLFHQGSAEMKCADCGQVVILGEPEL